jgi:hypothetical protein
MIPPELVGLAKLTYLALDGSRLTGLVPELQFEQYTRGNSNHWPLLATDHWPLTALNISPVKDAASKLREG